VGDYRLTKYLVPVGEGLGLILDEKLLGRLRIGRGTPLEVLLSDDGRAIEIRPLVDGSDHGRRVLESADRMMTIHEEVFQKLAQ
jgi:hypothetical protein